MKKRAESNDGRTKEDRGRKKKKNKKKNDIIWIFHRLNLSSTFHCLLTVSICRQCLLTVSVVSFCLLTLSADIVDSVCQLTVSVCCQWMSVDSVCHQHAVRSRQTLLWCPSRFCPGACPLHLRYYPSNLHHQPSQLESPLLCRPHSTT